jgi:hypothetical protein
MLRFLGKTNVEDLSMLQLALRLLYQRLRLMGISTAWGELVEGYHYQSSAQLGLPRMNGSEPVSMTKKIMEIVH